MRPVVSGSLGSQCPPSSLPLVLAAEALRCGDLLGCVAPGQRFGAICSADWSPAEGFRRGWRSYALLCEVFRGALTLL